MDDTGKGCANLAIAIKSLLLLYNPIDVTYGLKYEPVAKSYNTPLFELPEIKVGFWEKVNSFCLRVHLNCDSNMVVVLWKDIIALLSSIRLVIKLEDDN